MSYDLWLLTIKLISLSLALLAFGGISWVYITLLRHKERHIVIRIIGQVLLTLAFIVRIAEVFTQTVNSFITVHSGLTLIGLFVYMSSFLIETVPLKPSLKRTKHHRVNVYLFPFIPGIVAVFVTIYALARKIVVGLSKEYTYLLYAWIGLAVFYILDAFALGGRHLVLTIIATRAELFWFDVTRYLILMISSMVMLGWISVYIEFSPVLRLSLSVWQLIIFICLSLSAGFTFLTILRVESQITDLLNKNSSLVTFSLDETRRANNDYIRMMSENTELQQGLQNENEAVIFESIGRMLKNNSSIDKVMVTDAQGILFVDSSELTKRRVSVTDNQYIKKVIVDNTQSGGLYIEQGVTGTNRLSYVLSEPVFNKEKKLIGIITTYKYLNDGYLDVIKSKSGQEMILYVDGKRSASTLVDAQSLARYENIPLLDGNDATFTSVNENQQIGYTSILTKEYLTSISLLDGNKEVKLLIAIERAPVIERAKEIIRLTYLGVIAFCLIAIIPTVSIARRMNAALSA